jgi:hypothetical protein
MSDMGKLVAQLQEFVHNSGCTLVLPGVLLLCSACLLGYRSATEEHFDLPLSGFLANILLQMLPLAALKAKIYSCADRVSLVPLVLVKTILMHVVMLTLRITSQVIQGVHLGRTQIAFDCAVLLAALALLKGVFDYQLSPFEFLKHRDVRNLIGLAVGSALCTEAFFIYVEPSFLGAMSRAYQRDGLSASKVMFVSSNYVDIVAFMPVVWRLYQVENELADCNVGSVVSEETKRMVKWFFAFVIGFYSWDDVIEPCMSLLDEPLAMMAHAAHFMLLLDFAGFFLFQVGTPPAQQSKADVEQMQGLLAENGDLED